MYWAVKDGQLCAYQNEIGQNQDYQYLAIPEGVAPGNCKLVDGALVAMAEGERLNSNPFWAALRAERDAKLAACDWTQLPDSPVDVEAYATYRQALRDTPANTSDPQAVTWPTEPT